MQQGISVSNFRDSDETFRPYGMNSNPLVVCGMFESTISIMQNSRETQKDATFYVIEGGTQPLLGRTTAVEMGVLVLGLPSTQPVEVNQLWKGERHQFPKIPGIKLKISLDDKVVPVIQHARRPPIALLSRVEEKLTSLEKMDIIEPVSEFSPWVSPLVVIVKDNGDLRLCVDMRQANRAIQRECYMMPTFEDFLPQLSEARFFTRLDIKEAFHQLELDESSRHITTFITHKGLFRYKRLMFGMSCAPELFQRVLEQILACCENVVNYLDDILIFGSTLEEHNAALERVLSTLKEKNVLLNHKKCQFAVTEVEFVGHHLSSEGIRPLENKLSTLQSFRPPENVEELRSFLGLANYVGRFLPDLGTVTAPMRGLLRSNTRFEWGQHHQESFEALKSLISNVKTLSYFDNSLRTRLIVDASPFALGCVLVQFKSDHDDSEPRIISYASKCLSDSEKRYCQTEKEALAIVWAVERFSVYLIGRNFELETDHKALETIFSPTSKPCARIERWVLRLQSFTFNVKYRKGSTNIADPFSRLVQNAVNEEFDGDNNFLVLNIVSSAAIDTNEIEDVSQNDHEFGLLRDCLQTDVWKHSEVKPYEVFKHELGFVGDVLVRGTKLVVPKQLRKRMMDLAHEGHPGETVMKRRLRERVWWPGIDKEVVQYVQRCEGCRLVSLPERPEPMQRRQLPSNPWIDVAIDYLGPMPSGEYLLVIIDYYSRYKEVEIMTRITAKDTISRLDRIFTRLGYPVTITLDNARQFASDEFDQYCKARGITLNFTTPYWPQENGLVERQNRSLLKRLQISHGLKRDWKADLQDYLMMYYTSPHSITGKTPTEMMCGRTIRSKIPSLSDLQHCPRFSDVADRDRILKEKGRETADNARHSKQSNLETGDSVLMKNVLPGNKLTSNFAANEYTVVDKKGSRVTVEDSTSGKTYQRNSSHLKKVIKATEVPKEQQLTENYVRRHMDTMLPQTEQKQLRFYPGLPDTFRDFTM